MPKTKLDRKRNSALSFTVPSDSGEIKEILTPNESLLIVCEKAIYQARLPDDVDPQRESFDAKGGTHKFFHKGLNDAVVSRTLGQALELTKYSGMSQADGDKILALSLQFMQDLDELIVLFESLNSEFIEKLEKFSELKKQQADSDFIHDIPQIERLKSIGRNFFLTQHKCLKTLLELLNFSFPSCSRPMSFTQLYEYCHELKENNNISNLIKHYRKTLDFMWNIRNSSEHPNARQYVIYHNLELQKDNKISEPSWEYSYETWDKEIIESPERLSLIDDIQTSIENLGKVFEDALLAISIEKLADIPFLPTIVTHDAEDAPFRYSIRYGSGESK